jgi:signal transduction histidine kinase/ligand-binding sensor domain-containing protein
MNLNKTLVYTIGIVFMHLHFNSLQLDARDFVMNHLTTSSRISDFYVTCAIKDNRGFMWFGTEDGLNRFDGYDYKVYKPDPRNINSLPENYITCIADDGDYIWVGTIAGLSRYNKKTDAFKNYQHGKENNSISNSNVKSVLRDNKGRIWIGTTNGLNLFDPKTGSFIRFMYSPNEIGYKEYYEIRSITLSHAGDLWLCTTRGLFRFDPDTHTMSQFFFDPGKDSNNHSRVECIYEDEQENLWIGTTGLGLYYYEVENSRSFNYRSSEDLFSLCNNEINTVVSDADRNVWIGTNTGLCLIKEGDISPDRRIKFTSSFPDFDDQRISANVINELYRDNTNKIWVCGRFDVFTIDEKLKPFHQINFVRRDSRFITNNMTAIVEDKEGNIWFGTDGGGIYFWDRRNGNYRVIRHHPLNSSSIASDKVLALCLDSYENLWIGYWAGGLDKLDLRTHEIKHYSHTARDTTSLGGENIYCIFEDSQKRLWIGLWSAGLNLYNRKEDSFIRIPDDLSYPESLIGYTVIGMCADNGNNLYLATESHGLKALNTVTMKYSNYLPKIKDGRTISSNRLISCYRDSKDRIWICSQDGLNLLDPQTGSFRKFYESDGLSSNKTKCLLEDNSGALWISTDNGLSKLTISGKNGQEVYRIRSYSLEDGLQEIRFSSFSHGKSSRGEIIFGGRTGITLFNPDSVQDNNIIPPIVFTGLSILNEPVDVHSAGTILKADINETEELALSYKHTVFSIEFSALNFSHTRKNRYAYKLDGFDRDWSFVGSERKATYTHLDHGVYIFRVKGCNNDGVWNEEGRSLKIRISPPWYETLFSKICFAGGALFLLIFFYRTNITRVRKKNELLEKIVRQRTSEITRQKEEIEVQKTQLEKNNFQLMEQQHEMEVQTEELQSQTEELFTQTEALAQSNAEIKRQHQEIQKHRDELEAAIKELTIYRNNLEELVDERTRELILSKEKAEESDRLKSSFLANLSHEIRTPLNAIIGFAGLLSDTELSTGDRESFNFIIRRSSDTLLNLINDVIDFSKIEAGRLDVNLKEVPVHTIVDQVNDIFSLERRKLLSTHEGNLDFRISVSEACLATILYTDELRLMQVISNLINNAIKFTSKGWIEFGCKDSSNGIYSEFYVRDTGIGIGKENLGVIFERFRKLENDKSRLYRGAGLGLAISHELIHLLGGQISVDSEPGQGSEFSITVPIFKMGKPSGFKQEPGDANAYPDFSGKNILVAEDDRANFMYIEKLLRKTGATVIHASDGLQAVKLASGQPDLHVILMDIKMPEMNGIEALERIRESGLFIPVIALTAYALSEEITRLKEAGFSQYISKPVHNKELFKVLQSVLQ